jgi:hypothetical protein
VGFQHLPRLAAEAEVNVADDACADFGGAVTAGGAHGRDAVDEFGFADRAESLGAAGAVHGAALDEDGGDDVVPAVGIGQQVVQHVDPVRALPQMVVRVDDGQVGFQDGFGAAGQPVVTDWDIGTWRGGGCAHDVSPGWWGHCFPLRAGCQVRGR